MRDLFQQNLEPHVHDWLVTSYFCSDAISGNFTFQEISTKLMHYFEKIMLPRFNQTCICNVYEQ